MTALDNHANGVTTLEDRAHGILSAYGVMRATILYTTLAKLLGLRMEWARDRARLGDILLGVSNRSHEEWSIVLSVLAVSKQDGLPVASQTDNPSGFWWWCAQNDLDFSDVRKVVDDEQRRCFNHFANLTAST